jgi:capsule polysaccharide export protein KpsE/RkpR
MEYKESLLGVLQTLFKWKKPILITTAIGAVGSIVVSLLLPVYYESVTTFYAASPDLAMPERMFGATNEAMEYYGEDADIDRIMTIANSNELADYLIKTFNLYDHYDIDSTNAKAPYYVQLKLSKLYNVQKTKFDAIQLAVEDKDREQAAAMANAARLKIDEIAQRLIKTSQTELLRTYESNIREKESQLKELNDSLMTLRSTYGVYNTETQSELLATLLAEAEAKLTNSSARLEVFQNTPGVPRDTIANLKASVQGAQKEAAGLQERLEKFNQGLATVQVLVQVHAQASKQLGEDKERYKQIKSAQGSPFPAIHLVEEAPTPIIKSRPKRSIIVVAITALSFLFSAIGALIFDTYKDVNWKSVIDGR